MNKKALITGVTGQDGSYLAELLLKKEWTIYIKTLTKKMSNFLCIMEI